MEGRINEKKLLSILDEIYPEYNYIDTIKESKSNIILKMKHTKTKKIYLLKVFHNSDPHEFNFMSYFIKNNLKCKFISAPLDIKTFKNLLFIVYDFIKGGDLIDVLNKGLMKEHQIRCIARSMLKALNFLHSNKIIHCDIKPENILMNSNEEYILIDYDLAKKGSLDKYGRLSYDSTCVFGTEDFVAPENFNKIYGEFTDIWCLGLTLFTCVIHDNARNGYKFKWEKLYKSKISIPGKHFILSCISFNYRDRKTLHELLDHPWITNNEYGMKKIKSEFKDHLIDGHHRYHKEVMRIIENKKSHGDCCIIL